MAESPLLLVRDLYSGYGNMNILSEVNVRVEPGESVALVGTNGSGKSTLLRTICGLVQPTAGSLLFDGVELQQISTEGRVALGMTMVPESRDIFTKQSVYANLRLGAYTRLRRTWKNQGKEELEHVLSVFPVLKSRLKQVAGTLSGGEQQMLAIGRALMSRPRMLLLDEPSTGLAPLMVKEIFRVLDKLIHETSLALFLVEQNTKLALKSVARGYILERGRIFRSNEARALLDDLLGEGLVCHRDDT